MMSASMLFSSWKRASNTIPRGAEPGPTASEAAEARQLRVDYPVVDSTPSKQEGVSGSIPDPG